MTQKEILELLKINKSLLQEKFGVKNIGLFGSYAKNTHLDNSDIDVFVELKEQKYDFLVSLKLFLEKLFGKPVDVITNGAHLRKSFLDKINKEIIYV